MNTHRTIKAATESLIEAVHSFLENYANKHSELKLETVNEGQMKFNFPTSGLEIKTITQQAVEEGVKFFHQMDGENRYTIAYRPVSQRGKMLELAVAYTHPNDQYCKRTGARLAAERFLEGKTVMMPIRSKSTLRTYYKLATLFDA